MGRLRASVVVVLAVCCAVVALPLTSALSDDEINNVLEKVFAPESGSSMHARALRRDIVRRLYDALEREQLEDELLDYKRSMSSLARWGNLPAAGAASKRNLAALAKGGYIRTIPDAAGEQEQPQEEEQDKRSLESLVRAGFEEAAAQPKRGIAALARNGDLVLGGKRNIGALARGYGLPAYGKRYLGALVRSGYMGKRNVAALLRQDKIHGPNDRAYRLDEPLMPLPPAGSRHELADSGLGMGKRNVGAAKANGYKPPFKRSVLESGAARNKRDVDYYNTDEYAVPVYQNQNVRDYEEMIKALTGEYPAEKRFLGRLPQMGKSKTTPSPKITYK